MGALRKGFDVGPYKGPEQTSFGGERLGGGLFERCEGEGWSEAKFGNGHFKRKSKN